MTDPQTRRDYALVGAGAGTVFVDITDPRRPDVLGILPTVTSNNFFWRDIKVHANHAFVVSEDSNHGMQVSDLTQLRDWDGTYTTYSETALYTDKGRSHNLAINEDTGYAYLVGGAQDIHNCAAGLHIVDINDPANPTFVSCYTEDGYIHDVQCVVYEGPDTRFTGNEICFGSNEDTVSIIDVTDKHNAVRLAVSSYPNVAYSHQGWLTPDQQYFLRGDELDELVHGIGTSTRVWDVRDLTDLQLVQAFENDTTSIDHNIYTQGSLCVRIQLLVRTPGVRRPRRRERRIARGRLLRDVPRGRRPAFRRRDLEQLPLLPAEGRGGGQQHGPRTVHPAAPRRAGN